MKTKEISKKLHILIINDAYEEPYGGGHETIIELYSDQKYFTWEVFSSRGKVPEGYKCDIVVYDYGQVGRGNIIKSYLEHQFRNKYYFITSVLPYQIHKIEHEFFKSMPFVDFRFEFMFTEIEHNMVKDNFELEIFADSHFLKNKREVKE